jgi:hypothetical protein
VREKRALSTASGPTIGVPCQMASFQAATRTPAISLRTCRPALRGLPAPATGKKPIPQVCHKNGNAQPPGGGWGLHKSGESGLLRCGAACCAHLRKERMADFTSPRAKIRRCTARGMNPAPLPMARRFQSSLSCATPKIVPFGLAVCCCLLIFGPALTILTLWLGEWQSVTGPSPRGPI